MLVRRLLSAGPLRSADLATPIAFRQLAAMIKPLHLLVALSLVSTAAARPLPADPDTRAWWAITTTLSNDTMAGRDAGSADYERAATIVAQRFAAAGLKPAGDDGSFVQRVPMQQLSVERAVVSIDAHPLRFLHDITVIPYPSMRTRLDAPLAYRGYCAAGSLGDVQGKVVICHGTHRAEQPSESARVAAVLAAGAVAIVTIADPGFAVEPPRWPFAYARTVWLRGLEPDTTAIARYTLNADALGILVAGSGHDAARLIAAGSAGTPLPSFDPPARFSVDLHLEERAISAPNVLAVLPGSDPAFARQTIVVSAHLDGYGRGEPVAGDAVYNGTLDDAAYVALLIRLAERRHGTGFRRPLLLAAFTGEEKGLLGARWFVAHPTLPREAIAADINLDQLRPIFPLRLLTVHALADTTLGDDARAVAAGLGIDVQADPEPERNLLRRADQWPFLQAGIPATAFVFGYRPGTESERIYRHWYTTGYHKPQDDLAQPINWQAAADFNRFFYTLAARVADQPGAPAWRPDSALRPRP